METVTKTLISVDLSILDPFVKTKKKKKSKPEIHLNKQVREFLLEGTFLALKKQQPTKNSSSTELE